MNYKSVLESQIEKLEKLQGENINHPFGTQTVESAIKLAEEIRLLCNEAKNII